MVARKEYATKADLKVFKEEIIHEFHVVFGRVEDQLKLFAELQSKTIQRYDQIQSGVTGQRIARMEKTGPG